ADTLFGAGSVPVRAEESATGFLGQAWTWMAEIADAWTGWFGVATEKETTTTTSGTPSQSNSCTPQNPCDPDTDAGWGIDPNG
ncbi:MAG TPA: hypothetical protein VMW27_09815, partial [Thermoanaerobaculia bacterium]|nr:hypothetical protein [Thermoanaerobaculia bacterium]